MGKFVNYLKNNVSFFAKLDKEDHETLDLNYKPENFKQNISKIKEKVIFGLKFKW